MKRAVWIQRIGILALVLSFTGFWFYAHSHSPLYIYYDPELAYLMSSLTPFKGYSYGFIDHPGTPFQTLGTALFFLTRLFIPGDKSTFLVYHLSHPEVFLTIGHSLLTFASIGCAILLMRYAIRITHWVDALFAVAIAASFHATHLEAFETLILWSHNSLTFPAGTLLLLYVFVVFRSETSIPCWKFLFMGIGAGILTAAQFYFFTWIIGIASAAVTLRYMQKTPWKNILLAGVYTVGGAMIGFLLSIIPVLPIFYKFVDWIIRIIFHQGKYGGGAEGIASTEQLAANIAKLYHAVPLLFGTVGLLLLLTCVAVYLQHRRGAVEPRLWAVACGLSLQVIVTLVIIIKHPDVTYMLAVGAILPIMLALVHALVGSYSHVARVLYVLASVVVLAGFGHNLTQSIDTRSTISETIQVETVVCQSFFEDYARQIGKKRDELVILWTYGTYARCFGLTFGNGYTNLTGDAFTQEVEHLCPHEGHMLIWHPDGWAVMPNGDYVLAEEADWDVIVMSAYGTIIYPLYHELGIVTVSDIGYFFITRHQP
jgi:hypothetical protein